MGKRARRSTLPPLPSEAPPDIQCSPVLAGDHEIRPALVELTEWPDPADTDLTSMASQRRAHARRVSGYRRVSSIRRLHDQSPRDITGRHFAAAQRLLRDYLMAFHGAMGGGIQERVDGQTGDGGSIISGRMRAAQRWREAIQAVGLILAPILCAVVVRDWTIAMVAASAGCTRRTAHKRLIAGLDALADHYQPPREVATIVVGAEICDAAVQDIPQDRLGRWRRVAA